MLKEKTGISRIQKLYLQMLFHCNFNCIHCFQGTKLQQKDRFTLPQAESAISYFVREYGLRSVTLLGGEPFLHPNLFDVLRFCKQQHLETVVCTNGYKIGKLLKEVSRYLDHLRVSLDGVRDTHDAIRRPGSFDAALLTLEEAQALKVPTSITVTITNRNVDQIYELAGIVRPYGIRTIKLHQLRLIGNAAKYPDLLCERDALSRLAGQVKKVRDELAINVLLDDDLDPQGCIIPEGTEPEVFELERIEVQPDGAMYVSCKAVGNDHNAFWLDKERIEILYRPSPDDELATHAPQVRYARLEGREK